VAFSFAYFPADLDVCLGSVHPQTASFGPERRFRSFEILNIARYACGFKIAHALR
jgi:hypothetical protein